MCARARAYVCAHARARPLARVSVMRFFFVFFYVSFIIIINIYIEI